MIEVSGLGRVFKAKRGQPIVVALDDISFEVQKGELFGVLGPNGAGKTTLIRILSTLMVPSSGRATIDGFDVASRPAEVRPRIGVVFGGERGLYDRLSARDNLRFSAELYGLPARGRDQYIHESLEGVGLADASGTRVETFSRGMRQKLHIARALLHRPGILFLDEPTSGLDPVASRDTRTLVRQLVNNGTTVILTTHYMFEADELCDRVAVVVNGRLLTVDQPKRLKETTPVGRTFEYSGHEALDEPVEELVRRGLLVDAQSRDVDGSSHWLLRASVENRMSREELAQRLDVEAARIFERPPTLEDAYVALVLSESAS